ncbi:MAG: Ig-like domain-containing protein [bacterium]|nr:Ig-like domain-containing protein [bacterium]
MGFNKKVIITGVGGMAAALVLFGTHFVSAFPAADVPEMIASSPAPTVSLLTPTSGIVGAQITITGTGFTPDGNRIKFGDLGVESSSAYSLPSSNSTTITFTVPSSNYLSCWSTSPACGAPASLTQPGIYAVSVTNSYGTSNELSFEVTSATAVTPTTTTTATPVTVTLLANGGSGSITSPYNSNVTLSWTSANVPADTYLSCWVNVQPCIDGICAPGINGRWPSWPNWSDGGKPTAGQAVVGPLVADQPFGISCHTYKDQSTLIQSSVFVDVLPAPVTTTTTTGTGEGGPTFAGDSSTFPPNVSFEFPFDQSTISARIEIKARGTVFGGWSAASMQFFVDGTAISGKITGWGDSQSGKYDTSGFRVSWDTATVADGVHTIMATAANSKGIEKSVSRTVTVKNGTASQVQTTTGTTPTTAVSCDAVAEAVVKAAGGCGAIDEGEYRNISAACCKMVTKPSLLKILNDALTDGVIDKTEKAALLGALDAYLGGTTFFTTTGTTPTQTTGSTGSSGGNGYIQLCADINYGGGCETFTSNDSDLRDNSIGNDRLSSIRIPAGKTVALYDAINYSGNCETFTSNSSDFRDEPIGNDVVSSVRVGSSCGSGGGSGGSSGTTCTSNEGTLSLSMNSGSRIYIDGYVLRSSGNYSFDAGYTYGCYGYGPTGVYHQCQSVTIRACQTTNSLIRWDP